jgi:circadian clock protein KaiC
MEKEQPNPSRPPLKRVHTGNVELDDILGGGFPSNSINILMGSPGSGKTILVERLMFANAAKDERPILFLTTLSEPVEKVLHYLQQFDFYDEEKIANGQIVYDSIGEDVQLKGVGALVPRLLEAIKTLSPKIIVIDSFKAIHDLSTSMPEMRRMLFEVSGLLTAYDTTAFFLGEYNEPMLSCLPEFAVADGIVNLVRSTESTRDERYLSVLKLRGSRYREGLHAFRIGSNGLEVFPRLTSPDVSSNYAERDERISTGVSGLDKMLQGGFWAGTTAVVEGQTGAGKTTLALQFVLAGLGLGERGLYVNFQENPIQLARQVRSLGWNLGEAKQKGLHCIYTSPVELQIDSILVKLFRTIEQQNIKRVVVDAVGDLAHGSSDNQRLQGYLYALGQHFAVRRVSSLMTLELSLSSMSALAGQISAVSDIIIRLGVEQRGDHNRRTLRIVKARGTNHDLDTHDLRISNKGVEVL